MPNPQESYTGPERRRRPTPFLSRYTFWGRRRENLHPGSPQSNYYVDRIHKRYLWFLFLILGLSFLDGIFTLYHYHYTNLPELNPILAPLLQHDNGLFLAFKLLLTLIGAMILVLHQHFDRVLLVIYLIAALFIVLDLFHLVYVLRHLFDSSPSATLNLIGL